MAGKIVVHHCIEREKGKMYFVDKHGNLREATMKHHKKHHSKKHHHKGHR